MPDSAGHSTRSPSPHGENSYNGDHGSQSGNATKAPKDKECPFCHQPFTSSSLGRHLDLYIKPKNPKPPDGVHNVQKIRELRGKITRRQPRNSLKKQDSDGTPERRSSLEATRDARDTQPSAEPARPPQVSIPPVLAAKRSSLHEREGDMLSPASGFGGNPDRVPPNERVKNAFGTTNWQGTGVITGLPTFSADMDRFARPYKNLYSSSHAHSPQRNGHPSPLTLEGDEIGKAAQLALREVLDSLDAARSQAAPLSLFDFDYFGMTFPSLCLKLLPSPRTLFSLHPFSTPETWPLSPPSETQLHSLRTAISTRASTAGYDPTSPEVARALRHLDTSFSHWSAIPDAERQQTWHLEVLRAYSKSQKKIGEKGAELKLARQQAEFFRQQYERLVRHLDAKDAYLLSAQPLPVGEKVLGELEQDPEKRAWEYERLIGKWRGRLRGENKEGDEGEERGRERTREDTYGVSPTMAPPLRMDREREVRFFWEQPNLMGTRADSGGAQKEGDVETPSSSRREANGEGSATPKVAPDIPSAGPHGTQQGGPLGQVPGADGEAEKSRPGTAREGDRDWLDAASKAVVRIMKERSFTPGSGEKSAEGERAGGADPDREKDVNTNGKRARPPSWGEGRPEKVDRVERDATESWG